MQFNTSTTVNCSLALGDPAATLTLLKNGTQINNGTSPLTNITLDPAGTHNYTCTYLSTQNFTNGTQEAILTVTQAPSVINLTLNDSQENIVIEQGGSITIQANLTNGTGTIELFREGTLINIGTTPLSNLSAFIDPGTYNITTRYNTTQNFTGAIVTYFVTVTDTVEPAVEIVFPGPDENTTSTANSRVFFRSILYFIFFYLPI